MWIHIKNDGGRKASEWDFKRKAWKMRFFLNKIYFFSILRPTSLLFQTFLSLISLLNKYRTRGNIHKHMNVNLLSFFIAAAGKRAFAGTQWNRVENFYFISCKKRLWDVFFIKLTSYNISLHKHKYEILFQIG